MAYQSGRWANPQDRADQDLAARRKHRDDTDWNVLLISVDELAFNCVSGEGHPVVSTPNIDRLRLRSVRMAHAYATHPLCAPARHSWLTGLYGMESGITTNGRVWDDAHPSLVARFAANGWTTQSYGKLHTSNALEAAANPLGGYDEAITEQNTTELGTYTTAKKQAYDAEHTPAPAAPSWDADDQAMSDRVQAAVGKKMGGTRKFNPYRHGDRVLLDYATEWLTANASTQFFLHVGFRFPHYPFDCTAGFNDGAGEAFYYRHSADDVPSDYHLPPSPGENQWIKKNDAGWDSVSDADMNRLTALYWNAIEQVDSYIGALLDHLDDEGLTGNTLVVLVSDHGEHGGHRGLWLKSSMYEESVRQLTYFSMPGVLRPHDNKTLFSGADLLPTIGGLVGLGENFLDSSRMASGADWGDSLIAGRDGGREAVIAYSYLVNGDGDPSMAMAFDGRFKLVEFANTTLVNWDALGGDVTRYELYDLEADPNELANLHDSDGYDGVVTRLSALITEHSAFMRSPLYDTTP